MLKRNYHVSSYWRSFGQGNHLPIVSKKLAFKKEILGNITKISYYSYHSSICKDWNVLDGRERSSILFEYSRRRLPFSGNQRFVDSNCNLYHNHSKYIRHHFYIRGNQVRFKVNENHMQSVINHDADHEKRNWKRMILFGFLLMIYLSSMIYLLSNSFLNTVMKWVFAKVFKVVNAKKNNITLSSLYFEKVEGCLLCGSMAFTNLQVTGTQNGIEFDIRIVELFTTIPWPSIIWNWFQKQFMSIQHIGDSSNFQKDKVNILSPNDSIEEHIQSTSFLVIPQLLCHGVKALISSKQSEISNGSKTELSDIADRKGVSIIDFRIKECDLEYRVIGKDLNVQSYQIHISEYSAVDVFNTSSALFHLLFRSNMKVIVNGTPIRFRVFSTYDLRRYRIGESKRNLNEQPVETKGSAEQEEIPLETVLSSLCSEWETENDMPIASLIELLFPSSAKSKGWNGESTSGGSPLSKKKMTAVNLLFKHYLKDGYVKFRVVNNPSSADPQNSKPVGASRDSMEMCWEITMTNLQFEIPNLTIIEAVKNSSSRYLNRRFSGLGRQKHEEEDRLMFQVMISILPSSLIQYLNSRKSLSLRIKVKIPKDKLTSKAYIRQSFLLGFVEELLKLR